MWIVHSTLYFGHKQTLCLPNKYLKKERFCISDSFTTRSTLNSFSTKWSKSKYICIVNFEKIRRETLIISNFLIFIYSRVGVLRYTFFSLPLWLKNLSIEILDIINKYWQKSSRTTSYDHFRLFSLFKTYWGRRNSALKCALTSFLTNQSSTVP